MRSTATHAIDNADPIELDADSTVLDLFLTMILAPQTQTGDLTFQQSIQFAKLVDMHLCDAMRSKAEKAVLTHTAAQPWETLAHASHTKDVDPARIAIQHLTDPVLIGEGHQGGLWANLGKVDPSWHLPLLSTIFPQSPQLVKPGVHIVSGFAFSIPPPQDASSPRYESNPGSKLAIQFTLKRELSFAEIAQKFQPRSQE